MQQLIQFIRGISEEIFKGTIAEIIKHHWSSLLANAIGGYMIKEWLGFTLVCLGYIGIIWQFKNEINKIKGKLLYKGIGINFINKDKATCQPILIFNNSSNSDIFFQILSTTKIQIENIGFNVNDFKDSQELRIFSHQDIVHVWSSLIKDIPSKNILNGIVECYIKYGFSKQKYVYNLYFKAKFVLQKKPDTNDFIMTSNEILEFNP